MLNPESRKNNLVYFLPDAFKMKRVATRIVDNEHKQLKIKLKKSNFKRIL